MDDIYPSPLRIKTDYTNELDQRRKHDQQPYPVSSGFMLAGLSSTRSNFEDEYAKWVSRQIDLDNQGFRLLAKHYDLDLDASDFYMKVALHLARDHVPAFQMLNAGGAPKKWTDLKLKLLVLRVRIEMKKGSCTRAKAIEILSKPEGIYGLNGTREGLRNLVIKGERLLDVKKLDCMSIHDLQEVEKLQLIIDAHAEKELSDWGE